MTRYVGIKNNYICVVSDKPLTSSGLQVMELPPELEHLSATEIITNCRISNEGKIKCKFSKKPANNLKLALVGNWKMKCGIATYAENLWQEVVKHVKDYKLFIEEQDVFTEDIYKLGNQKLSTDQVSICWKRGVSPQHLIEELKEYDPDIIWIQHEFGLWPNAGQWLSLMHQLNDYRIIVTQHSVFHHKDKTICEAAIPEIVTHLQGGYELLKNEKQVPGKVYVIPHGCTPCTNKERFWNIYNSNHTIIQAGFLFRYKGWQETIKATRILKDKYPDIFFTGLCSESDHNKAEHQIYYKELSILINSLDLQNNVSLIRGYQSDQTWDSYFRTNKVAVFPYISESKHEVFGASGAARVAMEKYLPVITSYANHFSDLPTIKAQDAESIAKEIDKLFSDHQLVKDQLKKQVEFLEENSWENVAKQYIRLFET